MWFLFAGFFRKELVSVLECSRREAQRTAASAGRRYRQIIASLPEFEKGGRFMINIVNCAMLSAFIPAKEKRPDLDALSEYYGKAMMIPPMKWFCRMGGRAKFGEKSIRVSDHYLLQQESGREDSARKRRRNAIINMTYR